MNEEELLLAANPPEAVAAPTTNEDALLLAANPPQAPVSAIKDEDALLLTANPDPNAEVNAILDKYSPPDTRTESEKSIAAAFEAKKQEVGAQGAGLQMQVAAVTPPVVDLETGAPIESMPAIPPPAVSLRESDPISSAPGVDIVSQPPDLKHPETGLTIVQEREALRTLPENVRREHYIKRATEKAGTPEDTSVMRNVASDFVEGAKGILPTYKRALDRIAPGQVDFILDLNQKTGIKIAEGVGTALDFSHRMVDAAVPGLWDYRVLNEPKQIEAAPDDTPTMALGKQAVNAANGFVSGMSTTPMMATLALGGVPKLAGVVKSYFLADTLTHIPEAIHEVREAEKSGDVNAKAAAGIKLSSLLVFTKLLGQAHAEAPVPYGSSARTILPEGGSKLQRMYEGLPERPDHPELVAARELGRASRRAAEADAKKLIDTGSPEQAKEVVKQAQEQAVTALMNAAQKVSVETAAHDAAVAKIEGSKLTADQKAAALASLGERPTSPEVQVAAPVETAAVPVETPLQKARAELEKITPDNPEAYAAAKDRLERLEVEQTANRETAQVELTAANDALTKADPGQPEAYAAAKDRADRAQEVVMKPLNDVADQLGLSKGVVGEEGNNVMFTPKEGGTSFVVDRNATPEDLIAKHSEVTKRTEGTPEQQQAAVEIQERKAARAAGPGRLNIGDAVDGVKGALGKERMEAAIKEVAPDVEVTKHTSLSGETENTSVIDLSRSLTKAELRKVADLLEQDAIPQTSSLSNTMEGRNIEAYGGTFNGEYFKDHEGKPLSEPARVVKSESEKLDQEQANFEKNLAEAEQLVADSPTPDTLRNRDIARARLEEFTLAREETEIGAGEAEAAVPTGTKAGRLRRDEVVAASRLKAELTAAGWIKDIPFEAESGSGNPMGVSVKDPSKIIFDPVVLEHELQTIEKENGYTRQGAIQFMLTHEYAHIGDLLSPGGREGAVARGKKYQTSEYARDLARRYLSTTTSKPTEAQIDAWLGKGLAGEELYRAHLRVGAEMVADIATMIKRGRASGDFTLPKDPGIRGEVQDFIRRQMRRLEGLYRITKDPALLREMWANHKVLKNIQEAKPEHTLDDYLQELGAPRSTVEAAKALAQKSKEVSGSEEEFFGRIWNTHLKDTGLLADPSNPRSVGVAAKRAIKDIGQFLKDNPKFADYYNADWKVSQKILEDHYGRALTADELMLFKVASGLTSPNTMLPANVGDAANALDLWIKEGNFEGIKLGKSPRGNRVIAESPILLSGQANPNKANTLKIVDLLAKREGSVTKAVDYLREGVTTKELQAFNKEMGFKSQVTHLGAIRDIVREATGQDQLIPRMFIFGKKVGAYTLNSVGDHRYNTVDVWESRFVRSYFNGMFEKSYGLPLDTVEHDLFTRFSQEFKREFDKQTGQNWPNSSLQAIRWFYILDAAKKSGYNRASTNETVSFYLKNHIDTVRGTGEKSGRQGDAPVETQGATPESQVLAASRLTSGKKPLSHAEQDVRDEAYLADIQRVVADTSLNQVEKAAELRRAHVAAFPEMKEVYDSLSLSTEGKIAADKIEGDRADITKPSVDEAQTLGASKTAPGGGLTEADIDSLGLPDDIAARMKANLPKAPAAEPVRPATVPEDIHPELQPTGVRNARIDVERQARGLPPRIEALRQSFGKWWDEAMTRADDNPAAGSELVADIVRKPRALEPVESALLAHEQITRQNAFDKAVDVVNNAPDEVARKEAQVRLANARDNIQQLYDAADNVGTEAGRSLAARKLLIADDYTLSRMEANKRAANAGKTLSEEQLAEIAETHAKLTKQKETLDALEELQEVHRETASLSKTPPKPGKTLPTDATKLHEYFSKRKKADTVELYAPTALERSEFTPEEVKAIARYSKKAYGKETTAETAADLGLSIEEVSRAFEKNKTLTDAAKLETYKKTLATRQAALEAKIKVGDFTKDIRNKLVLDETALKAQADYKRTRAKFEEGIAKDYRKQRTKPEKLQDYLAEWKRIAVLSGYKVLGKLSAAAAARMAFAAVEEGVGGILSKIPGIARVAKMAPREGGFSVKAESKAITNTTMNFFKDAYDIMLKDGKTELDVLYKEHKGGAPRSPVLEFLGRTHYVVKSPAKRAEFVRSLQKRTESAIRNGADVTDPLVKVTLGLDAYKDAEKAIFLQSNKIVQAYQAALRSLEAKDKVTGKPTVGGKAAATALRVTFPIIRIPTNIVIETFTYSAGLGTGGIRLATAFAKGIEKLRPEEADAIMSHLKKGSVGGALLLLGYTSPDAIGGYYQPGEKRDEDDVKAMHIKVFGHDISSVWLHNPALEVLQIGATVRRVADSIRDKDDEENGIGAGTYAAAFGLAEEIPFLNEATRLAKLGDPKHAGDYFTESGKSLLVPQLLQQIAADMDRDEGGEIIKRAPEGFLQKLQTGVPGLREQIEEKE